MSGHTDVLATAGLVVLGIIVATWIASLALSDVAIVDIMWGAGFFLVAIVSALVGDGDRDRSLLIVMLVAIWGVRRAAYTWWCRRGAGEAPTYQVMRRRGGEHFAAKSLMTVFGRQGLAMWIVSLPVQLAMTPADPHGVGVLALIGVGVWGVGFFVEVVADAQLARFRSDPDNADAAMDRGIRRYCRHPNRLGELCVGWGIFLVAAETTDARYGIVGPIVLSVLLTRRSGVPLLERS